MPVRKESILTDTGEDCIIIKKGDIYGTARKNNQFNPPGRPNLGEQKVIDISKDSKSVRLDVYLHDEKTQFTILKFRPAVKETFPKEPDIIPG